MKVYVLNNHDDHADPEYAVCADVEGSVLMTADEILKELLPMFNEDRAVYRIRDEEPEGWDSPKLARFSELLNAAKNPDPPEAQTHLITCLRQLAHPEGSRQPLSLIRTFVLLDALGCTNTKDRPSEAELDAVTVYSTVTLNPTVNDEDEG